MNAMYVFAKYSPEELAPGLPRLTVKGFEVDPVSLAGAIIRQGEEEMENLCALAAEIADREAEAARRAVMDSGYRYARVELMMEFHLPTGEALRKAANVDVYAGDTEGNRVESEIYGFVLGEVIPACEKRGLEVDLNRLAVDITGIHRL